MSDGNVALVKELYAAFGRGDIGRIVGAAAPNVSWEIVGREADFPTFGKRSTPSGVQAFFQSVSEHCDFQEFAPREFYAAGNKVFVLGRYALRVKKTGHSIASDWIHVFTIENGKVSEFREFTDTAQAREAYGA